MADKKKDKKKKNIFQRLGAYFREVRLELKKVVWPSVDKLKTTSAVVLVVIAFFAVYLSLLSDGGRWLLDKIGFYDQAEPTVAETSLAGTEAAGTIAAASEEETAPAETEAAETSEETEAAE